MRFFLIVATRGRRDQLVRFLDSLLGQSHRDFKVLIVDQNENGLLDGVVESYQSQIAVQRICTPPRGKSAALNIALQLGQIGASDLTAFPDDDCWYAADTLERIARFFLEHPAHHGLCGREGDNLTDGSHNPRYDRESGEVTYQNVWRRHIAFTMFFRTASMRGLLFDETLGVGANTKWGSGEETDFLLRFIERGYKVYYDSGLVVGHPDWVLGPLNASTYRKAHAYGMGMGKLLRVYPFPASIVGKYLIRPFGGMFVSILRGRFHTARYYWSVFRGRLVGWCLSGEELRRKKNAELRTVSG